MSNDTKKSLYLKYVLFIAVAALTFTGCGGSHIPEKTAVKINNYTITAAEFNELFSELEGVDDTPAVREAFLDNLITRKLILHEAHGEGLDKEKDFLKAIENFWEQSLLTIVIDKKTKELSNVMAIDEEEIQGYYNAMLRMDPEMPQELDYKLRNSIRMQLLKQKQTAAIELWSQSLRKNADMKIDRRAIGIDLD
ncbi:MAG: SurA N-terminal domain-containing protein [Candidatus Omnitrophota bacterium]